MTQLLKWTPLVLCEIVSVIAFIMAGKNLLSHRLLPFHEQAAGIGWDKVDERMRALLIALMRVSGVGFLAVGIAMATLPIYAAIEGNKMGLWLASAIGFVYCSGLFAANFRLRQRTGTETPWKGSLYAAGASLLIAVLAIVQ